MTTTNEKGITNQEPKPELPVKNIHESIFWEADDPRWLVPEMNAAPISSVNECIGDGIDLSQDSFIIVYTGVRGAGKTTTMTYDAMRANYLWDMPIISNYPIEYRLIRANQSVKIVKAEMLDFVKLFQFSEDYNNCLLLIDEAPDVISHLAFMSTRNRLLNTWTRQIRKNHNSLFMGAQFFNLIDASFRQQVDVEVHCDDVRKKYSDRSLQRGQIIELHVKDCSGQWTGHTWQEEEVYKRAHNDFTDIGQESVIYPCVLWGNDMYKPVYNTLNKIDVLESLRKVEMNLSKIVITDDDMDAKNKMVEDTANILIAKLQNNEMGVESLKLWGEVEATLGHKLNRAEQTELGHRLAYAGGEVRMAKSGKVKYYDISHLDMEKFLK